jgi:hypothetical protein
MVVVVAAAEKAKRKKFELADTNIPPEEPRRGQT